MTTNTQVHETADPEPETFTVTIDPTKVDPEKTQVLGRFLDDAQLEKLAGGETFTVTIERGPGSGVSDQEWTDWKNALNAVGMGSY